GGQAGGDRPGALHTGVAKEPAQQGQGIHGSTTSESDRVGAARPLAFVGTSAIPSAGVGSAVPSAAPGRRMAPISKTGTIYTRVSFPPGGCKPKVRIRALVVNFAGC